MSTLLSNTIKPRRGNTVTFTDNVSIGGTVTYEDVSNVDSVGIITSQSGIKVGAGESISPVSGTIAYYGDGSNLSGIEPGVKNFVASGTIDNGATVIIKDDGTVGIVTQTTSPQSAGDPVEYTTNSTQIPTAVYIGSNKIFVAYRKYSNGHGYGVVGEISGTSITFGTSVVFQNTTVWYVSATYDSANERVVVFYRETGPNSYGYYNIGTVSGTSISFPSPAGNAFNSWPTEHISSTYDSTNQKVIVSYKGTDVNSNLYGTCRVGTVDAANNTISFGNEAVFWNANIHGTSSEYVGNDKVVIAWSDEQNSGVGNGLCKTGTVDVANNTISFPATAKTFNTGTSTILSESATAYDSDQGKIVIAYRNGSNGNGRGEVMVGAGVTSGNPTFGSAVEFEYDSAYDISPIYDDINKKVVVFYRDNYNSNYVTARVGTVVGFGITFDSGKFICTSTGGEYISSVYDPATGKVAISYQDTGGSNEGAALVYSPESITTNLTSENYIGIAGESISNGATGKINITGGINSGQTGLTTAQKYYVGQTGILTTTADTPSVVAGTSISDTKIVIK